MISDDDEILGIGPEHYNCFTLLQISAKHNDKIQDFNQIVNGKDLDCIEHIFWKNKCNDNETPYTTIKKGVTWIYVENNIIKNKTIQEFVKIQQQNKCCECPLGQQCQLNDECGCKQENIVRKKNATKKIEVYYNGDITLVDSFK